MRPDHPTSPCANAACDRLANDAAGFARPPVRRVARIASKLCGDTSTLLGLLAILCVSPSTLGEEAKLHIYCWTDRDVHTEAETLYYTGVFPGYYFSEDKYLSAFEKHLIAAAAESGVSLAIVTIRSTHRNCTTYRDSREKVEVRLQAHAKGWPAKYRVVYTNWTPDGRESGDGQLSEQPVRDFTVSIGGTEPYTERGAFGTSWTVDPNVLSICVRDHECEDGDRVAVTVNGNGLLTVEIAADWQCEDVRLGPGTHAIELHAVNGTGFKGDCSHADINTGEIMVASDREDSVQRWRHRGGTGSSARLKVTLE